jgi:hypothetical protein
MNRTEWAEFAPYFTPQECGLGMDYEFMKILKEFRRFLGLPMKVHGGWEEGHASNGYHPKGRAIDFHVNGVSPRFILHKIDSFGKFGGVGYYPEWNNPGFHVDNRPLETYQRWVRRDGIYIYAL